MAEMFPWYGTDLKVAEEGFEAWDAKRKAVADPATELPTDAPADDSVTADRESLKATLKDAGVSFGGNTSTEKLAEMVANLTVENPDT